MWWPETGSNRRRRPFQGLLPVVLSGLESADIIDAVSLRSTSVRIVKGHLGSFRPYDGRVLVARFSQSKFGIEPYDPLAIEQKVIG